jgi:hypothetical protein
MLKIASSEIAAPDLAPEGGGAAEALPARLQARAVADEAEWHRSDDVRLCGRQQRSDVAILAAVAARAPKPRTAFSTLAFGDAATSPALASPAWCWRDRQDLVLDAAQQHVAKRNQSPTIRDLARHHHRVGIDHRQQVIDGFDHTSQRAARGFVDHRISFDGRGS